MYTIKKNSIHSVSYSKISLQKIKYDPQNHSKTTDYPLLPRLDALIQIFYDSRRYLRLDNFNAKTATSRNCAPGEPLNVYQRQQNEERAAKKKPGSRGSGVRVGHCEDISPDSRRRGTKTDGPDTGRVEFQLVRAGKLTHRKRGIH